MHHRLSNLSHVVSTPRMQCGGRTANSLEIPVVHGCTAALCCRVARCFLAIPASSAASDTRLRIIGKHAVWQTT